MTPHAPAPDGVTMPDEFGTTDASKAKSSPDVENVLAWLSNYSEIDGVWIDMGDGKSEKLCTVGQLDAALRNRQATPSDDAGVTAEITPEIAEAANEFAAAHIAGKLGRKDGYAIPLLQKLILLCRAAASRSGEGATDANFAALTANVDRKGVTKGYDGSTPLHAAFSSADAVLRACFLMGRSGQSADEMGEHKAVRIDHVAIAIANVATEAHELGRQSPFPHSVSSAADQITFCRECSEHGYKPPAEGLTDEWVASILDLLIGMNRRNRDAAIRTLHRHMKERSPQTGPKLIQSADDVRDAARWRALFREGGRVRVLGTAGVHNRKADGYAHIGVELWTKHLADDTSDESDRKDLTAYADIAARAVSPTTTTVEIPCDDEPKYALSITRARDGDFHFSLTLTRRFFEEAKRDGIADKDLEEHARAESSIYLVGTRVRSGFIGGGSNPEFYSALAKVWPKLVERSARSVVPETKTAEGK